MSLAMCSQEDIDQQQTLLSSHRGTLSLRLQQQAMIGVAHVPPEIIHDINHARGNIQRIKDFLRGCGVPVADLPIDASFGATALSAPFWSVPRRNPLFVERIDALRILKDTLCGDR